MRILIYKRTHRGDPDWRGIFGIYDCMGRVRDYRYDAVIGIGGIGADPQFHGIAGKITWVGIGPRKTSAGPGRGTHVTFDHFLFHDTNGPDFRIEAPQLAKRIYRDNIRILINGLSPTERDEAMKIVRRARSSPPSRGRPFVNTGKRNRCPTAKCPRCRP